MQFLWDVHHICNLSRNLNVEIYVRQDECKGIATVVYGTPRMQKS